jgi:hypothetical protein
LTLARGFRCGNKQAMNEGGQQQAFNTLYQGLLPPSAPLSVRLQSYRLSATDHIWPFGHPIVVVLGKGERNGFVVVDIGSTPPIGAATVHTLGGKKP